MVEMKKTVDKAATDVAYGARVFFSRMDDGWWADGLTD